MSLSVNKPVNKQQKDADVNRKLQLYGIYSAFQNGKVPSVRLCLWLPRVSSNGAAVKHSPFWALCLFLLRPVGAS